MNPTVLRDRVLKVVIPKIDPPYLNSLNYTPAYEKAVGYGPGIAWELLRDMAHQLNLTFDVQTLEGEGWGQRLDNGSWTGAFGRLYDGHAEILAGGSMMTPERYANFDFSTAIGYQSSAILIRQPRRRNFVANMLVNSFGWKIWLSLLACFFLAMLAFHFIQQKISKVAPEKNYGLADTLILFFAVFSKQQVNCPPRTWSARILVATLWICSIFLTATFGANVISLFAHGTSQLPFTTLDELIQLVKAGEWKLVLDMKSTGRIEMLEVFTADPVFSKLMNDPERLIFVNSLENGVKTVQHFSGNAAFVAPSGRLKIMASLECNVTVLPNHILATYLSIAFRKGSPYRRFMNKRVLDFWQNGLLRRWMTSHSGHFAYDNRNRTKCAENWDDRLRKGIFGLIHFEKIFILLGIGLAFAAFMFICEMMALL